MKKVLLYSGSILLSFFFVFFTLNPASALDVKISGQVNQMVIWADNGDVDDFFIADNDNSSTRIRATGEEAFGNIKAGFQFEIEAQRNASNAVAFDQDNDGSFGATGEPANTRGFEWNDRWFNVYLATAFGKFEIGKGDTAANNTTEVDLSGTAVINYSDVGAFSSGLVFEGTTITIGSTRTNMDGALSRAQRVRYNTPVFAGFMLAASAGNGGSWDSSLWYTVDLAGNKIAAAVGYAKPQGTSPTTEEQYGGSISWLAPFGLNLTFAYGERSFVADRDDAKNWYAKAGYRVGVHAFSIEYGETKDLSLLAEKGSNWGVAYVVNPWKPVEFYASYRHFMLDDVVGGPDPDDIQVVGAGTRIRF